MSNCTSLPRGMKFIHFVYSTDIYRKTVLHEVVALIYGKMVFCICWCLGVNKKLKGYKLWQKHGQSNNLEMNGSDLAWNEIAIGEFLSV